MRTCWLQLCIVEIDAVPLKSKRLDFIIKSEREDGKMVRGHIEQEGARGPKTRTSPRVLDEKGEDLEE